MKNLTLSAVPSPVEEVVNTMRGCQGRRVVTSQITGWARLRGSAVINGGLRNAIVDASRKTWYRKGYEN